jgi:predicted phage-related endonuclease
MDTRVPANEHPGRRTFIGGSDARIIMGDDQDKLIRLWHEKRGEVAPPDLSQDLIVQLGSIADGALPVRVEYRDGAVVAYVQHGGRVALDQKEGSH